ncbi:McrC family protein, partial [Mycoplasmopsis cynos]
EVESNQNYIKGKLLIKEQINKNLINKNKFYIKYDSYNSNKPENKIIKSVLLKLKKETKNINIQKTINNLLSYFLDVESSKNFENDYRKIIFNKNNFYYKDIIEWSIIFLRNNSFINFSGNHNVKALLFNMHFLFESYISKIIEKTGHKKNYKTKLQDKSHWLFAYKKVPLRPDIVVNKSEKTYVIDVKWKTIEKESDISQSDFYQIFAYNAQYKSEKSYLIYPKYKNINSFRFFSSGDNNKLVLEIIFFDLTNDPFKEIENLFL